MKKMVQGVLEYARKEATDSVLSTASAADANGGDSSAVLAYLQAYLQTQAPDVLLLNCGLHDLRTDPGSGAKQVVPDKYRENLEQIVQLVQDRCVRTVWVRTTPVDDARHNARSSSFHRFNRDVVVYNEIADGVFGGAGTPIIDLYAFVESLGEELFCDHVHFVDRVRALQAAFIAGHLIAICETAFGRW